MQCNICVALSQYGRVPRPACAIPPVAGRSVEEFLAVGPVR